MVMRIRQQCLHLDQMLISNSKLAFCLIFTLKKLSMCLLVSFWNHVSVQLSYDLFFNFTVLAFVSM